MPDIQWEARPVLYFTLTLDPTYIPTREELQKRLDFELAGIRQDVLDAWDKLPLNGDKKDA